MAPCTFEPDVRRVSLRIYSVAHGNGSSVFCGEFCVSVDNLLSLPVLVVSEESSKKFWIFLGCVAYLLIDQIGEYLCSLAGRATSGLKMKTRWWQFLLQYIKAAGIYPTEEIDEISPGKFVPLDCC